MITIVDTRVRRGYTGWDHLIDSTAERAAQECVGCSYRTGREAVRAVRRRYVAAADERVRHARVDVHVRYASGRTEVLW